MRKLLIIIFTLLIKCTFLVGYEINELSTLKQIFIPPSMSEDGKSFVYTGSSYNDKYSAIFVSHRLENDKFSVPEVAITTDHLITGINEKFQCFFPLCGKYSAAGFNAPSIKNNVITFCSPLKNFKDGIFYAIKKANKWVIYPIAIQGDHFHKKTDISFKSFNSPYLTTENKAIFLATLDNQIDVVCSVKIEEKSKIRLLHKSSRKLCDFYNISVHRGTFATRAQAHDGRDYIYIYDPKKYSLVRMKSGSLNSLYKKHKITIKGPSLFAGKIAFSAYIKDKLNQNVYAIYTNAGNNDLAKTIVKSNKLIEPLNIIFDRVWNPTLFVKNGIVYISFAGYLKESKYFSGVYLAKLENGKVTIDAIAVPGQKIGKNKVIKSAKIGAVSLREGIIPLALKYRNNRCAIAYVKIY
ncbi:hypothetical protein P0136_02970 [Lentisphaerota bacterium ZTH]|nr:hypothetical protein JYG24_05890 [Lentisphaerota bacterium]WET06964.1 hypothetical protein P0136_02970 [Lentisphaerota bacterium ZTH]